MHDHEAVALGQPRGDRAGDLDRFANVQPVVRTPCEEFVQGTSVGVFEDQVDRVGRLADFIKADDVSMGNTGCDSGFAQASCAQFGSL